MLDRARGIVPDHAEQMDAIYRYQRHIYDITRKYYLLGRDRLIRTLDAAPGMSVLEVGCGTGRNLIAVARHWPQAHCFGFDISPAMLDTARASVARHGLADRIALRHGDATDFAARRLWGHDRFDRIVMSYTLSMIPGWELAVDEAVRALAAGGSLHIVDFGQQERLPPVFRKLLFAWLARFDVAPRGDMQPVLEDIAARHGLTLAFTPLYRGYAWRAVLKRPVGP
ncbi:class I SAM-dependent methyltransferase [Sphingobium algorifonticola]|uniref:Methyltransferase domain-containing protein n=1 Tax=Sphingobium algorifonticola TaxID=2008318 RepID=A0A437J7E9_9SPHN|nr:class I SAM-dependent methyltransferase [Sphingobium algorifonticola]RVT41090.1 methyltransferase domain-containing protein [Sphingobium algorifonticola]